MLNSRSTISSLRSVSSQVAWQEALQCAAYFASQLDRATICCFLELHEMDAPWKLNGNLDVLLLSRAGLEPVRVVLVHRAQAQYQFLRTPSLVLYSMLYYIEVNGKYILSARVAQRLSPLCSSGGCWFDPCEVHFCVFARILIWSKILLKRWN